MSEPAEAEALQVRVLEDVVASMGTLLIFLGNKMGLFSALHSSGRTTSAGFASSAGIHPRYATEFLSACATHGYIAYHPEDDTFELLPHAYEVLCNDSSPFFIGSMPRFIPSLVGVLGNVEEAFKEGGGVEYEKYGADIIDAIARYTLYAYTRNHLLIAHIHTHTQQSHTFLTSRFAGQTSPCSCSSCASSGWPHRLCGT
jgi:hypothetical protein